jgi:RNA polymerase sigma-70 factor (ECF subfamily)
MSLTTPVSLLERIARAPRTPDWERFVELYTPLLFAWAARAGATGDDASDLVQDVFTILVEKLPQFRYDAGGSFRGWLRTVLQNRWRQLRRADPDRTRRAGAPPDLPDHRLPDLTEAEYTRHIAQRALGVLEADFEPRTWAAFWAFVVEERPAAEVAARHRISVNAVYLAKARVLARLRAELAGLLD